jgi:glyoxylase-like metal-dependent hydrolase (beta-lactamase superfamily II)
MHAPGHTPGHVSVWIESRGEALLLLGDAAVHPLQLANLDHVFSLDADPQAARFSRARLLAKCAKAGGLVAACHFPEPGVGRLSASLEAWQWQPVRNR